MSELISMEHEYETTDGRRVRLLCTDGPGDYPVIGLVGEYSRCVGPYTWAPASLQYRASHPSGLDLVRIDAPPRIQTTVYINLHRRRMGGIEGYAYDTPDRAAVLRSVGCIGCVAAPLHFCEGDRP